jgi:hypothetical protein
LYYACPETPGKGKAIRKMDPMDDVQVNQQIFNDLYEDFFNIRLARYVKNVNAGVNRCSQSCIDDTEGFVSENCI